MARKDRFSRSLFSSTVVRMNKRPKWLLTGAAIVLGDLLSYREGFIALPCMRHYTAALQSDHWARAPLLHPLPPH